VQEIEVLAILGHVRPRPMNTDFWLKGAGELADGTEVDVLRGNDGGPLPSILPHFYFSRWTKFLSTIAYADQANLLQFGRFICRDWGNHPPPGESR